MLRVNQLSKTYPNGVKALDSLTLEISNGMFGLLGPNGAGKSTLMRTLATLQQPDSGTIIFNDIDVLKNPVELRKILGYLPQDFGVYPKTSAIELLDYLATLKGVTNYKERKQIINHALAITNLEEVSHKNVDSYSGGMKQRFGIAQLLLNNPKFIIVDEPTAGLDPAERNRFLNVLRNIAIENVIIFSTHIVDDIKDLCNNMAVMNSGKILASVSPSTAAELVAGKIWTIDLPADQLKVMEQKHQVLFSRINHNNSLTIRIYSAINPGDQFVQVSPNLEDVYFAAMKMGGLN